MRYSAQQRAYNQARQASELAWNAPGADDGRPHNEQEENTMSEWKNGKAVVYEDRYGITRCGACCAPLLCNDCGDMPETCPQCSAPLDYSIYDPARKAEA